MNNAAVTSDRRQALAYADSARALYDHVEELHDERAALGMTDVDRVRAQEIGRQIGEANGQLGIALKLAGVFATLDVAAATREAGPTARVTRSGRDEQDLVRL